MNIFKFTSIFLISFMFLAHPSHALRLDGICQENYTHFVTRMRVLMRLQDKVSGIDDPYTNMEAIEISPDLRDAVLEHALTRDDFTLFRIFMSKIDSTFKFWKGGVIEDDDISPIVDSLLKKVALHTRKPALVLTAHIYVEAKLTEKLFKTTDKPWSKFMFGEFGKSQKLDGIRESITNLRERRPYAMLNELPGELMPPPGIHHATINPLWLAGGHDENPETVPSAP